MASTTLQQKSEQQAQARHQLFEGITVQGFTRSLFIFAIVIAIAGLITSPDINNLGNAFHEFYANVSSEALSILITVVILDRLNARRQDQQELTRLKALMKSDETVVTRIAVAELRAKGWLEDGSLAGANLSGTNLQKSGLLDVNLQEANLYYANLQEANLYHANLQEAYLGMANLRMANLHRANLKEAHLKKANLQFCLLWLADLRSSDLSESALLGANLMDASFDENTILPDAVVLRYDDGNSIYDKYWTPDTDMTRYTNPNHPDFWQPDWVKEDE